MAISGATLAIIGIAVAAVGAGVSAYAASEQAAAQRKAAAFNEKQLKNQALLAQYAADQRAKQAEDRHRRILASQRVAVGLSGITNEGSPLTVMLDTASEAAYQEGLIRYGGQQQSEGFLGEASLQNFYGDQATRMGYLNIGRSLLSGASSATSAYASYKAPSSAPGIGYGAAPTPTGYPNTPY